MISPAGLVAGTAMADIHILTVNGETAAYPKEFIAELLRSGRISSEALYWREGMADWEPVATYRGTQRSSTRRTEPVPVDSRAEDEAAAPAKTPVSQPNGFTRAPIVPERRPVQWNLGSAEPATRSLPERRSTPRGLSTAGPFPHLTRATGRSLIRFRRDPWLVTIALEFWLVVCLAIALVELKQGVDNYSRQNSAPAAMVQAAPAAVIEAPASSKARTAKPKSPTLSEDAPITRADLLKWSGWISNLLLLAPYFFWLYRTAINSRFFSPMMRLQPALAVGSYFVPFVNLFRPCQDMQEIWRVSGNPRGWLNERGSALVMIWWILALTTVGVAVENGTLFATIETHDDMVTASLFYVVKKLVQIAWYLVFMIMVALIVRRQKSSVTRDRRRGKTSRVD